MSNEKAPDGHVFVCLACGNRSKDRYGDETIDYGWDVSCVLNSTLCKEEDLVIKDGRVVEIQHNKKDFKDVRETPKKD